MAVVEYKCPSCGAALRFDSSRQKLFCDSCGNEFDVEAMNSYMEGDEKDSFDWPEEDNENEWLESELEELVAYSCPSCGGEIVTQATTAASSCPFCGNPAIYTKNISGMLKPDCIIPFKLNKKQATEAFEKFFSNKPLLPPMFKSQNTISEIKGIYVPFWLFGCSAKANATFRGTTSRSWSDKNYRYTETRHYALKRSGNISFEDVPVDASKQADDAYMQAIEPYRYVDIKEFKTSYLSGYFADRYDEDVEECQPKANERITRSTIQQLASTCSGYSGVTEESSSVQLQQAQTRYALLPVWMLSVKYNGEDFHYAMNGQTGKFVGKLPIDNARYLMFLIGLSAAFTAIATFVASLLI